MDSNKTSDSIPKLSVAEVDIATLWHAVDSRKYYIALVVFICMLIASVLVSFVQPKYRAVSTVLIEKKQNRVVSIEQIYSLDGKGDDYLFTQFELLRSRSLAVRVVRKLNLLAHVEFDARQVKKSSIDFDEIPFGEKIKPFFEKDKSEKIIISEKDAFNIAVNRLMKAVSVIPVDKTQLVRVSVELADAKLAAEIANVMADAYIESQLDARMEMNQVATEWINSQLSGLKEKLEESERRLQQYREEENLLDWKGVAELEGDELTHILERQAFARQVRTAAESRYEQVRELENREWKSFLDLPAVRENSLVKDLQAIVGQNRIKYVETAKRYGPKHPKMQAATSALESAEVTLAKQVMLLVSGIKRDYELALAEERAVDDLLKLNNEKMHSVRSKEFKLVELQRDVDTNLALYDTFLTRLKETTATSDLEEVNIRVVDKAVIPRLPFKPKKKLIVVLAGALAAIGMAVLFVLLELKKNVIKTSDDVENKIGLPLLGGIPQIDSKKSSRDLHAAFVNEDQPIYSEAIRTVRTSLLLSDMEKDNKTILVTSSVSGEGKSTVAANLALALGKMEKVVLVCADMRKNYPGAELLSAPGLSELIQDKARLSEALISQNGIDIIHPGEIPANPLELLSTERFSRIVSYLNSRYDRIIIDSAPTEAVSDALVLSTSASSVLYIVKADDTTAALVRRGVNRLLSNNASVLGIVLNQVVAKGRGRFGYGKAIDDYGYGGY